MKEILSKIKALLSEITELDAVYLGEPEERIPASVISFADIDEAGESSAVKGNYSEKVYHVLVRVVAIVPNIHTESALNKAIDLSAAVEAKLAANPELDGLVKSSLLEEVIAPDYLLIDDERFARARRMRYRFTVLTG